MPLGSHVVGRELQPWVQVLERLVVGVCRGQGVSALALRRQRLSSRIVAFQWVMGSQRNMF